MKHFETFVCIFELPETKKNIYFLEAPGFEPFGTIGGHTKT
jgi:hypothetical protein